MKSRCRRNSGSTGPEHDHLALTLDRRERCAVGRAPARCSRRQDVGLVSDAQEHPVDDGQRQRQPIVNVDPFHVDVISQRPRRTDFFLTTSMPRAAGHVGDLLAVEKPGQREDRRSRSARVLAGLDQSRSIPWRDLVRVDARPSSCTRSRPAAPIARSNTVPARSCLRGADVGRLRPWSTALRIMWTSGSLIASTMLRSISVSSPSETNVRSCRLAGPSRTRRHLLERALSAPSASTAEVLQLAVICRTGYLAGEP